MAGFFEATEEEINFNSFTKLTLFIFGLVKFNFTPIEQDASRKEKFFFEARLNLCRFNVFTIALAATSFLIHAAQSKDFVFSSTCILNAISVSQVGLKIFATLHGREKIWNIIQALKKMSEIRGSFKNKKYRIKSYFDEYLRTMKIYSVIIASAALPVVILPLIKFVFFGIMEPTIIYWYPIDVYQTHTFFIALLWCDWIGFFGLAYLLAVDSLVYVIITMIAMEFEILREDFEESFNIPTLNGKHPEIMGLVKRQIDLYELVDELQGIYELNFLFSFVISSLIICFVAFILTVANGNLTLYSFFIPFLGVMMGQIFLLCMYGQKLMDASAEMAHGIYNSNWSEVEDISVRKQLVLIMERCQKEKRLTAMGFADISLPIYARVRFLFYKNM